MDQLKTSSPRKLSAQKYGDPGLANSCAQCGETIIMPEWSEYLGERRVRHLWECEACGYVFETTIAFAPQ